MEESEPGSPVHLPLDHLRFRVDSFGAAVVEGHGERRCGGLDVQVQSAGEGVDVGQVSGPGSGDPLLHSPGVARVRDQVWAADAERAIVAPWTQIDVATKSQRRFKERVPALKHLPQVLIGVGLPDDAIHAPNEKFDLRQFYGGIETMTYLYDELAAALR